jgi:hypothetical protein
MSRPYPPEDALSLIGAIARERDARERDRRAA